MTDAYGPKGSRVLFENDQVRVWEIELAPGEMLAMHHHDLDYVVVSLTAGETEVTWEDGRRERREQAPGLLTWREGPHAHALTNTGSTTYRNRMIELKR